MTRVLSAACLFLALMRALLAAGPAAQNTWDYGVQVSAEIKSSPAQITLRWEQDSQSTPSSYLVSRKRPSDDNWSGGQSLPGTATSYTDENVAVGERYEYRVVKRTAAYTGYGYIQSGIAIPLVDNRGSVVLVVDRTHRALLADELARLELDLVGDGWTVLRHDVGRNDSVSSVKALIKADYLAAPSAVKSVFLIGHVPVPYSGKFAPDAHPDHVGAWPADVYYGNLTGQWTDSTVNFQQTLNHDSKDALRQANVPGDGKFDQSVIPGVVELAVGRVDFANMPGRANGVGAGTFPSEVELLRQYLNKDHAFRHGMVTVRPRAVVGDYFGVRGGEAFAASGYRSFAPLVGPANVANLNIAAQEGRGQWISTLSSKDYLVAYGCGPGTYRTIEGLGHSGALDEGDTVEMVRSDVRAVFTLIYGSWLGDWDSEDNFMRAILASPTCTLTAAWSGRPHWYMHPMGLGESIGYVARLTQNNRDLYQNQINGCARQTHIALMGDPTLRLHPVAPCTGLKASIVSKELILNWQPSPDATVGYHIYRAASLAGPFVRLTSTPVTKTVFASENVPARAVYMVRAVKLEQTPSGSFFNASQGVFWPVETLGAPIAEGIAVSPVQAAVSGQ